MCAKKISIDEDTIAACINKIAMFFLQETHRRAQRNKIQREQGWRYTLDTNQKFEQLCESIIQLHKKVSHRRPF